MLTAIVVGVASSALGLALVVRIKEAYGTVEEDEIVALDQALELDAIRTEVAHEARRETT
jgi:multicomponent Na+:H+ antiporter subunit C